MGDDFVERPAKVSDETEWTFCRNPYGGRYCLFTFNGEKHCVYTLGGPRTAARIAARKMRRLKRQSKARDFTKADKIMRQAMKS